MYITRNLIMSIRKIKTFLQFFLYIILLINITYASDTKKFTLIQKVHTKSRKLTNTQANHVSIFHSQNIALQAYKEIDRNYYYFYQTLKQKKEFNQQFHPIYDTFCYPLHILLKDIQS